MSILGLDEDPRVVLSLDTIRALNSQDLLTDDLSLAIFQELQDGSKTYQELYASLRGMASSARLLNRLNDLIILDFVKEKSGDRKILKRRYALQERVTTPLLDHLTSTSYTWPDPWYYAILQAWWGKNQKKQIDTTGAFFQCPFLSKNQVNNALGGFGRRGWSSKRVTRVGRRTRIVHELNLTWYHQFLQDLHERIKFLNSSEQATIHPNLSVPLQGVPIFFFNKYRFLHLCLVIWLYHVDDHSPWVVDLQRALFLKKAKVNAILKDLTNLRLLEVYKTEQSGTRRIIPNKNSINSFLDCLKT